MFLIPYKSLAFCCGYYDACSKEKGECICIKALVDSGSQSWPYYEC